MAKFQFSHDAVQVRKSPLFVQGSFAYNIAAHVVIMYCITGANEEIWNLEFDLSGG